MTSTQRSKWFLFPAPLWFEQPPEKFDDASQQLVREWFESFPPQIAALIVSFCLLEDEHCTIEVRRGVNSALRFLQAPTSAAESIMQGNIQRLKSNNTPPSPFHSMNVFAARFLTISTDPSSARYAKLHWKRLRFNYYYELLDETPQYIEHTGSEVAAMIWGEASQHEIVCRLRSIFEPPVGFTPANDTQWLIAADMLEESGDIRASVIRAALTGDFQKMMQELLRLDSAYFFG